MYTFKKERTTNPHDFLEVAMKTDQVTLSNIVEDFQYFLKGCGFQFERLEVIVDKDEE